jgi:DNA-binding CsgD family transcriptional regulator
VQDVGSTVSFPVTSSRLVGRAAALAALEAALASAAGGRPSLAFVAGESGIGKTRLLAELTRRARDAGALVLAGACVDFGGEGELAYLPLVAALRPLARGGDAALSQLLRDTVAPLVPALAVSRRAARPVAEEGQAALFEGLLSLLDALGREQPVLLVLEDLHWADPSTRAALRFLAANLNAERALVVASYRSDELSRSHPLRSLLAELELDPRAHRIALGPLSRDELAVQLTDILGGPPAPDLLERLWVRSGGNPLFSEELLAAEKCGHTAAPDSLRDTLMPRVERLSDVARELLGLIAVAQRLDHRLLADASGLQARALHGALREAVDRHLVVVDDDGEFRLRHALLGEVVQGDLLPGERLEAHLALARAFERRLGLGTDAQLAAAVAHHYAAAGEQSAALGWAVRAATAAERIYAHGEAAALLERALELWDRVPDAERRAGADRVAVLTRAGAAAAALGDPARQLALLEAALDALGPAPDPARAAPILQSIARAQRHLNRAKASIVTLERALQMIESDPARRAGLLAALARARLLVGHSADAATTARQALAVAVAEDLRVVEGHARNTLGCSLVMTGEVDDGLRELHEAIEIAREEDDLSDLGEAHVNCAETLHTLGRSSEARAVALEGREWVAGRRPIAMRWLDMRLAEIAFDVGDWDLAERTLPALQPWTGAQSRLGIDLRRLALALGRGEHAAATALLRRIEPIGADSSEPQAVAALGAAAAELHRREGDLDAAAAAVDEWLARIECRSDDARAVSVLAAAGVTIAADAAERARDLGDARAESAAASRAEELLARVAAAAAPSRPVERAALLSAGAETHRAHGRAEPEAHARAAAAWQAIGRPEPTGRARLREAEAHLARGDRDGALAAARAAHAVAVRLGAGWLRDEVERLAARARLVLEADDPACDEPQPDDDAFGLTSRERQVLVLVSRGATNREIGATLFMAEKTASVHVSRILGKLNARTRTEAAAVAHRHQLA